MGTEESRQLSRLPPLLVDGRMCKTVLARLCFPEIRGFGSDLYSRVVDLVAEERFNPQSVSNSKKLVSISKEARISDA